MDRENRRTAEALTVISGVVLSSALAVFFYVKTDTGPALGTLAGLIGTVITLQVEALVREHRLHEESTRQQRLVHRVEAIAGMSELLDHSLGAYAAIEQAYADGMPTRLARKTFEDCLGTLQDLQRGRYSSLESEDAPNSLFHMLIKQVQHSLLTTTARSDIEWWLNAAVSRNYWQLNREAMQRGVHITRIFLYREWTEEIDLLAKTHHEAGVRVMRVAEGQLPPMLRENLLIWDGVCGFEPHYNALGEWMESSYTFASQDVTRMIDRFKLIESCAERFPQDG